MTNLNVCVIEIRSVYGWNKAYPISQSAITLARIAGTKTLTRQTLIQVENLGYDIVDDTGADINWKIVE